MIAIESIWSTRREHPVTVTFDDTTTPIGKIPFPAITICSAQKIEENKSKINEYDGYEQLFPGE